MDDIPAEWRAIGGAEATAGAAPAPAHTASPRPGRSRLDHKLTAALLAVAVGLGGAGVVAALWISAPGGDVVISSGSTQQGLADSTEQGSDGNTGQAQARDLAGANTPVPGSPDIPTGGILVDVEGAVRRPGLQRLAAGARVGDAIAAAGGYSGQADLTSATEQLNLAAPLADGAKVRVPRVGDASAAAAGPDGATPLPVASQAAGGSAQIDLNHADQAGLESLPGIGPVTAGKILAARAQAPFATLDDLVSRNVVGASILEKIRDLVTVVP